MMLYLGEALQTMTKHTLPHSESASPAHSESNTREEDYFSHPLGSANPRQSTTTPRIVEGSATDGEASFESCATTPGDPFLSLSVTPAITPVPSAPNSTPNLVTFTQLAGAPAPHLSVQSQAFNVSSFSNGSNPCNTGTPEVLPSVLKSPNRNGYSTPNPNLRRKSFQARSKIACPALSGLPSQARRPTHRAPRRIFLQSHPTLPLPRYQRRLGTLLLLQK